MREIKFRVWDKDSKTMYSNEVIDTINFYDGTVTCSSGGYNEIEWDCEIQNSEILQYTGFVDTKGIEIYEGDILEGEFVFEEEHYFQKVKAEVYFDSSGGTWAVREEFGAEDLLTEWIHYGDAKVIGNIYENPNLIDTLQIV